MQEAGIVGSDIYMDKQSGKDFNRHGVDYGKRIIGDELMAKEMSFPGSKPAFVTAFIR